MSLYADILLPLPIKGSFTYRVAEGMQSALTPGQRVVVPFGKSKCYTGLVRAVHPNEPTKYEAKEISALMDEQAIVNATQMEFWEWIANYYMCSVGEVMQAALPSAFLISSETKILKNPEKNIKGEVLSDREYLIVEALNYRDVLSYSEVSQVVGIKTIHPLLKSLYERGIILFQEELRETYTPKLEMYLSLAHEFHKEASLKELFASLSRAAKQEDALMRFLALAGKNVESFSISKKKFLAMENASSTALVALMKRGVIVEEQRESGRLSTHDGALFDAKTLNEIQVQAEKEIQENFEKHDVVLLHGITGSGKTEIYIQLIQQQIELGKQVLYLLPEIALTTQIITRLRKVFGGIVGIYHSRYSNSERVEVWNKVLSGEYKVVLGARSSLFMPFNDLSLIIIDEEHEASFKQQEPAPRYHARDMAVVLASKFKAKVLMGSATPSIESYHNAVQGKFGLVKLEKRHGGVMLPEILCADVQTEKKKKLMTSIFSSLLLQNMEAALDNKEQVILFQNRRGFAPVQECSTCGHIPKCNKCDVSLTYHKFTNLLKCHYCGYSEKKGINCNACGSLELELVGFGTQKIEEDIKQFFPKAKIGRMDWDTTRTKNSYQQIIADFEDHNIDILVGTQMISKGLDFDNVALVGVLNADQMLNFPDFRAHERAYQLMSQVSGRAGRKSKRGKVVIQTYNPNHNVIQYVIDSNYEALYQSEILQRRNLHYPPFVRFINLTVKHPSAELLNASATFLADHLREALVGMDIFGPEFPAVSRIRGEYIKEILIKVPRTLPIGKVKEIIQHKMDVFNTTDPFKKCRVIADVDPN